MLDQSRIGRQIGHVGGQVFERRAENSRQVEQRRVQIERRQRRAGGHASSKPEQCNSGISGGCTSKTTFPPRLRTSLK